MSLRSVPLEPSGDQARQWLQDELGKSQYAAAQPTLFDRISEWIATWFLSLLNGRTGIPTTLLVITVVILLIAAVVAILLFGVPRRNRRSTVGALFGEEDRRTAADLRRSADQAAAAGDWRRAVLERFRAIARGLDERTLVEVFPGTTAVGFARSAARVLPAERDALADAARLFDGVRYADRDADRADAERLAALHARVVAARPRLTATVGT